MGRFVTAMVDAYRLLKADRDQQQRMYDEVVHAAPDKPYPAVEGIGTSWRSTGTASCAGISPSTFYDSSFVQDLYAAGYFDAA